MIHFNLVWNLILLERTVSDFRTAVSNGPIISALINIEQWWNHNWQEKTEILGEEPDPRPLCPPYLTYELPWDGTLVPMVRKQQ
jgi:hypothetical protein